MENLKTDFKGEEGKKKKVNRERVGIRKRGKVEEK